MQHFVLHCDELFDGLAWHAPGYIEVKQGVVQSVSGSAPSSLPTQRVAGLTLPGIPNLHSHAFQRIFAGLTEHQAPSRSADSFWSWREQMYRFASRLSPEDIAIIAEQLYVEMLEAGYTSVGEFHYLHHSPSGEPYADLAELARRVAQAARASGIRLTLLPVFYAASGFGPKPPLPEQARFINTVDRYLALWELLQTERGPNVELGFAPHSLRAAPIAQLGELLRQLSRGPERLPVHIHISEQKLEVEQCLAHHGLTPVELLFEQFEVGPSWCLVHATHLSDAEIQRIAQSRAVVGLCPTTEANLGDGFFPTGEFIAQRGRFGVGSDSQISVSPIEELRWLEYSERLKTQTRNALIRRAANGFERPQQQQAASLGASEPREADTPQSPTQSGVFLLSEALLGGAQALGSAAGRLTPGSPADLIQLDMQHPSLVGKSAAQAINSWIFANHRPAIDKVMVAGRWLVEGGVHISRETTQRRFAAVAKRLFS